MSSAYVRTQIKQFLTDNSNETVVDLTSQFEEIKELLADEGVQPDAPWLGLDFVGADELPIGLAAGNDFGTYRETGAVHFHFCAIAQLGNADVILTRGETLRNLLRGRRIGDILIDSVTPMNFAEGATLKFDGGYMSGSFYISYRRDLSL